MSLVLCSGRTKILRVVERILHIMLPNYEWSRCFGGCTYFPLKYINTLEIYHRAGIFVGIFIIVFAKEIMTLVVASINK